MAEGEITTFTALTEKFNLPPGNYKKPKLLYCSNGGHFLRILPDGTVDGTRDRSDQHNLIETGAQERLEPNAEYLFQAFLAARLSAGVDKWRSWVDAGTYR
ncbi:fibroblast growth factor 1 isoform X3 [Nycticebus coucang]|uniref:fibroblast growth factor 1 isoform X3 n=1 Tax=Nycticebus coucang TaxID=9470 RepID=UPI00234C9414|nr:fibroblast growth factor 1 isoform X3 [Nycticebus coucang]